MKTILYLLLLVALPLQAQDSLIDSLQNQLKIAKTDTAKVRLHLQIGKQHMLSDAKSAIAHGQTAAALAQVSGFPLGKAKAHNLLGLSYVIMGEYDKSLEHQYSSLKIGEQTQDTATLITSYIHLGSTYNKINDYARAVKNHKRALTLALLTGDKLSQSRVYNNIGNIYEAQGKYEQALAHFKRAAHMQEELKELKSLAISLHNIGNVHLLLQKPEQGLPYLFRSVRINDEIKNDIIQMASYIRIGEIYLALGQHSEALKYADRSHRMAVKSESARKMAETAKLMHEVLAAMQKYEEAYRYTAIEQKYNAIQHAESRAKIESEITAKYETEQRELENRMLRAEKLEQDEKLANHKNIILLGVAALLLILLALALVYRNRQGLKNAYSSLQEAHALMQEQKNRISAQHNEIITQSETLKLQNAQLGKHNLFKNKVFSIISHDLRGPYYSIKGILNLARLKTLTEDEVKNIFGLLSKEMDVAMNLLDNVLVWAKSQLEGQSIKSQTLNLHQLAADNLKLVETHAAKKQIILFNKIQLDAFVFTDKERLNFVLRNLLMNAVKFSFEGGEIAVEASTQHEDTVITVSDKGKGISAANLQKLFTDSRFTTPGTLKEKGTGLGLMLCKELVESLNGSISVCSEEGNGSTFTVILPNATLFDFEEQSLGAVAV